jgi:hypothetical protein
LFSHHLSRRGARIGALIAAAALFIPAVSAAAQTATSDTSPVNLSNSINMANGKAQAAATVVEGDARFEVLAPEVIRMEYSPAGSFLDEPTFDIMDRDFTVPAYTSSVSDGELTITTSQMTLSYQVGSGPFTAVNTKMQLLGALPPGASAAVTPTWGWECTFGQACQAGAASLSGGASIAGDHLNYLSPAGFVAGLSATGADASWQVLGAPAGSADVVIRYSNSTGGDGNTETRTESLVVNGMSTQVSLPTTSNWNTWSTVTVPVTLTDRGALPACGSARRVHPLLRLGQRHLHRHHPDVRYLHREHPADGRRAARPVRLVPARRLADPGVDLGRLADRRLSGHDSAPIRGERRLAG